MELRDIGRLRLRAQRIADDRAHSPLDVIRHMGAMQAQDYHHALWAFGLRLQAPSLTSVEAAVTDARILRTWSQRGTIHFVPAADTRWMLDLCASRALAGHGRRMCQLDLTDQTMGRAWDVLQGALARNALSRPEVYAALQHAGISTEGQRGYHILWHLAHQGYICMSGVDGRHPTFALLAEWAPEQHSMTREEALCELVRRYFTGHGPATVSDFARWSGLTLTDTRAGIAANVGLLTKFVVDGVEYWATTELLDTDKPQKDCYMLPAYDEFVIGYKDRDAVVPPEHAAKIIPGNNGVFKPVIVVDGQIVGLWSRKLKRKTVSLILTPFDSLDVSESLVNAAASAYADFIGLALDI